MPVDRVMSTQNRRSSSERRDVRLDSMLVGHRSECRVMVCVRNDWCAHDQSGIDRNLNEGGSYGADEGDREGPCSL
jgi:hypothetical protein